MQKRDSRPAETSHSKHRPIEPVRKDFFPERIADHELLRCIGRGSYGEVWLAKNMMGTFRAIKILYRKNFEHQRPFDREIAGIRKFEPISRSYEGFVDVLQVGDNPQEGYFYYIMELGDDQHAGQQINPDQYSPKTLANEVALRERLPVEECIALGLSLSSALRHLHQHGLIHRDVKPSNIIFVNGVPKLADIGLVVDIGEAHSYVGTEGFIPPEGPSTAQADVYSLGKVLYEISTGKDRNDFPTLPSELDEFPSPARFLELNEVILLACHKDPRKRYPSADALYSELVVLESGKSVKRLRLLEQQFARLRKVAKFGAVALIGLFVAGGIFYQVQKGRQLTSQIHQRQMGANVAYGTRAMEEGNLLGSLPFFLEALRLDQQHPLREKTHRVRLNAVLAQCPRLVEMLFHKGQISSAEFSPEGDRILIAKWFGEAQVWDMATSKMVTPPFGQREGLESASFSPNGTQVITASQDKTACLWDAATEKKILQLSHPAGVYSAQFSPTGDRVLTGCEDGKARIWSADSGELLLTLVQHSAAVTFAAFSRDGRQIVTSSKDNTARIWDAHSGVPRGPPLEHQSWVFHASFSSDGLRVITAGFDRKALVWDVSTGRVVLPAMVHHDAVRIAEFSPDGRYIITGSWDSTAHLWNAHTGQSVNPNPVLKHSSRVMYAAFHPDGHRIVTGCMDGTIRIWDIAAASVSPTSTSDSYSFDGRRFVVISNNWIKVIDAASGAEVSPRIFTRYPVQEAALSRDGNSVLVLSAPSEGLTQPHRKLEVFSISGKAIASIMPFTNTFSRLCFNDNSTRFICLAGNAGQVCDVASGKAVSNRVKHDAGTARAYIGTEGGHLVTTNGETAQLWDLATGKTSFPAFKHASRVSHVQFSPNGRRLVTCCTDSQLNERSAQIWNLGTGEKIGQPLLHRDGVLYASWSPDGQRVVTASEDFTAIVWDADSGRQLTPAFKHLNQVKEANFSQNGRWVATVSSDKTTRIWDSETGEPLTPPLKHSTAPQHCKFVANDSRILVSNDNGEAWLWDLHPDNRSLQDLTLLTQLLSEDINNQTLDLTPLNGQTRSAAWQRLRLLYATDFTTPLEEILSWHSSEAELSVANRHWTAALFHLNRLLDMRPQDEVFVRRHARVHQELAELENKNQ